LNKWFFFSIATLLLIFGFFNFINNFFQFIYFLKKKLLSLKSNNFLDNFIIFLIMLYFVLVGSLMILSLILK
jgi:hypothetical protein